jgi:hypothetical protein
MHIRNLIFLLAPALLFGQLSTNTVSVTASSSSTQQPDQAVFSVTVSSGIDKNLSDILSALSGSGISGANLVSVASQKARLEPFPLLPSARVISQPF